GASIVSNPSPESVESPPPLSESDRCSSSASPPSAALPSSCNETVPESSSSAVDGDAAVLGTDDELSMLPEVDGPASGAPAPLPSTPSESNSGASPAQAPIVVSTRKKAAEQLILHHAISVNS